MKRFILTSMAVAVATLVVAGIALAQTKPEFKLGFKALADQIPAIVGDPIEDEHWEVNGDSQQRTTTGLMVWRNYDRWTAFTNGSVTWILGPYGLQSRLNTDLYPWEMVPPASAPIPESTVAPTSTPVPPTSTPLPVVAAAPTATSTPTPARSYSPDVKAMDDDSGGRGAMVKSFMQTMEAEWARVWGWSPRRPTTVYLYSDGYRMADGMAQILGLSISIADRETIGATGATARGNDSQTGGWAILMNLNYRYPLDDWSDTTQANVLHEYAHLLLTDLTGQAGPQWFREGFAEWTTYSKVGGTPAELSVLHYTTSFNQQGKLPSLATLNQGWDGVASAGAENSEAAYGVSYLSVKYLAGKVGGMPLLQTLERTAAGENFETALQSATGYSINKLDSEYRGTIPAS